MATRKAQSANAALQTTQTCVTVTQVENYSALSSVELDFVIRTNFDRCEKFIAGFNKCASELFPALLEMESRFEKKQGARNDLFELKVEGWHDYLESRGINPATFRKWKQRSASMKQLQAIMEPPKPPRARSSAKSSESYDRRLDQKESDLLAKAGVRIADTLLNPLFTKSERVEKAVRLAEELKEAVAGGNYRTELRSADDTTDDQTGDLLDDATPIVMHSITPALTRMSVPSASSQDANEALLQAAEAAAITAANAVTDSDIKPRYRPVLMFYTNRQTVKFGLMLKRKGIESYSHRGKTCYDFPPASAYRTYEEAWEYARVYRETLSTLDVRCGVQFEGDGESLEESGHGRWVVTLIELGAPESLHGG